MAGRRPATCRWSTSPSRPKQLTVTAGATVGFVNAGVAPHTATSKDGSWDTGIVRSGTTTHVTVRHARHVHLLLHDPPADDRHRAGDRRRRCRPAARSGRSGSAGAAHEAGRREGARRHVRARRRARSPQGGTVTWTVDSLSPHIARPTTRRSTSTLIHHGETFRFTFDKPGTYTYHDGLTGDMHGHRHRRRRPGDARQGSRRRRHGRHR